MAGYNYAAGMSNNAVAAYDDGLLPASKIKGIPAALIEAHCRYAEWHHSSKAYNRTKFYDPAYVRARFGLEASEEHQADADAVAALSAAKTAKKADSSQVLTGCSVEWLEWSGSLSRPRCEEMKAEGCTVVVKGQTATITLADGSSFIKRLSTRGFRFTRKEGV